LIYVLKMMKWQSMIVIDLEQGERIWNSPTPISIEERGLH